MAALPPAVASLPQTRHMAAFCPISCCGLPSPNMPHGGLLPYLLLWPPFTKHATWRPSLLLWPPFTTHATWRPLPSLLLWPPFTTHPHGGLCPPSCCGLLHLTRHMAAFCCGLPSPHTHMAAFCPPSC
ncbi:hypothetical protein ACOMHN_006058 [Nucella lapillus]